MSVFQHVSDQGVRAFLEGDEELSDFNLVAKQLNAAFKALDHDAEDAGVPLEVLERREQHYDEACEYFGWRDLPAVRECLRYFWRV